MRKLILLSLLVTGGIFASTLFVALVPASAETLTVSGQITEFALRPAFSLKHWTIAGSTLSGGLAKDQQVIAADFNGDRCVDLLTKGDGGTLEVFLSDCQSSFKATAQRVTKQRFPEHLLDAGYIDKDSCADILAADHSEWVWLHSTCDGQFTAGGKNTLGGIPAYTKLSLVRRRPGLIGFFSEDFDSRYTTFSEILPLRPEKQNQKVLEMREGLLIGTADVNGDGLDELVFLEASQNEILATITARLLPSRDLRPWRAAFSAEFTWPEVYLGDFNGDGRSDILSRGSGIAGWWLAHSNGSTGLEQPVQLPLPAGDKDHIGVAGDFDGDGFAEVLRCSRSDFAACEAAEVKPGAPLAGVTVSTSSGKTVQTDAHGTFTIPFEAGTLLTVRPSLSGYQFSAPERSFQPSETSSVRSNFLAVSDKTLSSQPGRSVYLVPVPAGPKVCVGYFPESEYGASKWGPQTKDCPPNTAWYSTDDNFPGSTIAGKEFSVGYCCPLPADDILSQEVVEVKKQCPEDSVVIGAIPIKNCNQCNDGVRCAKINTSRYRLGPVTEGVYWGQGASSRFSGRILAAPEIPAAIRNGVSRYKYSTRDVDGCIGDPAASLYVGNSGHGRCNSHLFRQLQYSGRDGDPAAGTVVQMFPKCPALADPYDPTSGCSEAH